MNYLAQLDEDEVRYICSVIPLQESVYYFKRYPKDFAKVMPGFRAISMRSQEQVSALLFRCRKHPFILSFIEKHISRWIEEIKGHIAQIMDAGANRESALLQTLPYSFFVDNIGLFFKLANEEYSKEYITLLSAAIKIIKETDAKREKLEEVLKDKDSEIKKLQTELELVQLSLERTGKKFKESSAEIKALKCSITELEKLKTIVQIREEAISTLKAKVLIREKSIQQLKAELSEVKYNHKLLENKIQDELEKQQAVTAAKKKATPKPICPKDMEEFKDYLGYNLENIGVPTDSEYFYLLKEHLCCILFQGIPILINRVVSVPLMKCVANALTGTSNVRTLTFMSDISEQIIDEFLSADGRIVCLDNFVGNYNETVLSTLCDKHKDRIIFLTVAYDRTVYFVPDEFLKYCHYLNLNRIEALSANVDLTEDPSTIEVVVATSKKAGSDTRYSPLLREVLREFEFRQSLAEYKCSLITNEQDLCRLLAFDIMPYCVDVLQTVPYNVSERLVKYAGDAGRCPYKNLFRRWFG